MHDWNKTEAASGVTHLMEWTAGSALAGLSLVVVVVGGIKIYRMIERTNQKICDTFSRLDAHLSQLSDEQDLISDVIQANQQHIEDTNVSLREFEILLNDQSPSNQHKKVTGNSTLKMLLTLKSDSNQLETNDEEVEADIVTDVMPIKYDLLTNSTMELNSDDDEYNYSAIIRNQ